ncbi:MAG TPA: hypothetical protein VFQ68_02460 [Streptosporangiaceae bacterium]|nr:hypothetical protein [Streptosporangiaceae bacterium]
MTTCELLPRELTSRELASGELSPRHPVPRAAALQAAARVSDAEAAVKPRLRRGRLVALAVGMFLLPWCVVLGMTLPAGTFVPNWSLAWVGLDFAEAVAALLTAWLLSRGSPRAGLPAMAGAGLLFADAWFDVCTSAAGTARLLAVGEALGAELPLAAAAIWLAVTLTRHPSQA